MFGCVLEMLGAAEGALARAVEHAHAREQFGQPIGKFQAVRHLLAWAMTDCAAIETAAMAAVALDAAAPPRYDAIVKALAGRNARRACERSLQALGAIGFTAEHEHHHFHSRVLALDSLLGTSSELTHELGQWLREQHDPRIALTMLTSEQPQS
jgi:alkylation response protein AidB-like acyl-CoA dehydrogenase